MLSIDLFKNIISDRINPYNSRTWRALFGVPNKVVVPIWDRVRIHGLDVLLL
jgi:hypothetical protein